MCVESTVFSGCNNLSTIVVEQGNTVYDSRNNCNAIIETAKDRLVSGCKGTAIPDGIKTIGANAFSYCWDLASITIPSSVTTIENAAFYNTAIASIVIPNTVINIGGNPFAACNSLSSFVVEEGNPIYYSSNNCLINKNNKMLVAGCSTSTIPNDILIIGPSAFEGLHNIQTITIPEGVWAIQSHAFSWCTLQTLRIPNSVENVGQAAFSDLYEVKKIYLGSGVRRMDNDVFRGCPQHTDIYITATEVPISNNSTFNGIGNENPLTVHVPAEALDAYKASLSWSTMNLVGDADR